MGVDPRLESLTIVRSVALRALDGDVLALEWLEKNKILTPLRSPDGRIEQFQWNEEIHDRVVLYLDRLEQDEEESP